ncbi:sugar ABC transporter ATP-binding protein [Deinococcus rubellus]|uniref:sugar ABC transporter ATP-binding protein n=1 Tax=Deinococcus rubellus TaxID=1889240 RepID=UPI0031EF9D90
MTLRKLSKSFGSQAALQEVDLTLQAGEVHALVGENGAGKSTLIKVLTGVTAPSGGDLRWDGRSVSFTAPSQAQALGIRAVHQERQLVPGFSALENLYLGLAYPQRAGRIDWRAMRLLAQRRQAELDLDLPLSALVQDLTPTQRTLTELLRAVMQPSRLLILDEPTASLTDQDAQRLFALVRSLSAEGCAVLYVSHRLEEVLDLADRVTVLRGGQVAGTFKRGEAVAEQLVSVMSGTLASDQGHSAVRPDADQTPQPLGADLLNARHLASRDGRVRDVSFALRSGEILGIYGLAGSGRSELLETLAGFRVLSGGTLEWAAPRPTTVLIPEDRRAHGLVAQMGLRENVTLATLGRHARRGVLSRASERQATQHAVDSLQIRAADFEQRAEELSGGNQQKVVFARALAQQPHIWLCDEPTQAVDVLTRRAIHRLLRDQTARGAGVVFVTSDLSEMLDVAGRVLVLSAGRSVALLEGPDLNRETILRTCYGSTPVPSAS